MISVVIPLYNKAATIERAILSVLNQSYQDFELIVVDDGSSDKSLESVTAIQDERIKIISQPNQGVSAARNRGIGEATSEYVTFLDADDEWMPDFLKTVHELSTLYPHCAVFATAYQKINAQGRQSAIQLNGIPKGKYCQMDNYFEVASQSEPPFCSISIMLRKEAIQSIGGFPTDIHQGEDLLTWARLAAKYKIAYCQEAHSIFYTRETSSMDKPKRIPPADDRVSEGLRELYHQNSDIKGLRQYISHWHKMRASMFLRLPDSTRQCRAEIKKAQQWGNNKKLNLYQILLLIPYPLRMQILKRL